MTKMIFLHFAMFYFIVVAGWLGICTAWSCIRTTLRVSQTSVLNGKRLCSTLLQCVSQTHAGCGPE